ncbi:hypothetical protein F7U66_02030 [Vibrio parahaemolyticus]|nr:hypothetical protein [Vibrio parahaemolyticus]
MSKILTPSEMGEIVTMLLANPNVIGELEHKVSHDEFLFEISDLVTRYCGGEAHINPNSNEPMSNVAIRYNETLPCPKENAFKLYDAYGFETELEEHEMEIEDDTALIQQRVAAHLTPIVARAVYCEEHDITPEADPGHWLTLEKSEIITLLRNKEAINSLPVEHVAIRKLLMLAMNFEHSKNLLPSDLEIPIFVEKERFRPYPFLPDEFNKSLELALTSHNVPHWLKSE